MTIKDFLKDKTWNGSLARVLTALGDNYWEIHQKKNKIRIYITLWEQDIREYFDRWLLNSDWTDATLFDQSKETQNTIALLLGWKDVTSKNN